MKYDPQPDSYVVILSKLRVERPGLLSCFLYCVSLQGKDRDWRPKKRKTEEEEEGEEEGGRPKRATR